MFIASLGLYFRFSVWGGNEHFLCWFLLNTHQAEVELCDSVDFNPKKNHPWNRVHDKHTDCLMSQFHSFCCWTNWRWWQFKWWWCQRWRKTHCNTKSGLLSFHLASEFACDASRVDPVPRIRFSSKMEWQEKKALVWKSWEGSKSSSSWIQKKRIRHLVSKSEIGFTVDTLDEDHYKDWRCQQLKLAPWYYAVVENEKEDGGSDHGGRQWVPNQVEKLRSGLVSLWW